MKELSVAECLREADQQVRDISFDMGELDSERLLASFPAFFDASRRALRALTWSDRPTDIPAIAALETAGRRTTWQPPAQVESEPRMSAATDLLDWAAELIERHGSPGAVDRLQVSNHIIATLCAGTHVVVRGAHEYIDATRRTAGGRRPTLGKPTGHIPRPVYVWQAERLGRIEDLAAVALRQAGNHPAPRGESPGSAAVEAALSRWTTEASTLLQSSQPSVDDMRMIAQVTSHLEMHSTVIASAAHHAGMLSDDQLRELVPAFQAAGEQWAAAAGRWPRHMASPQSPTSRQARDAGLALNQVLGNVTHPDPNRWATAAEITDANHVGRVLEQVAAAHPQVEHLARDYEDASTALIATGQVTVAGRVSFEYTGTMTAAQRATVPATYANQMSHSGGKLQAAAGSLRSALDTATLMTPEAARGRARVPLSMSAKDIDKAIRGRVEEARRDPKGSARTRGDSTGIGPKEPGRPATNAREGLRRVREKLEAIQTERQAPDPRRDLPMTTTAASKPGTGQP